MQLGQAIAERRPKRKKQGSVMAVRKLPRELLRDLIDRSGLTQTAISKAVGLSHTSAFNRYLRPETQKDNPISINMVHKLLPVLVGTGNPPITQADVMALAGIGMDMAARVAAPVRQTTALMVRYRLAKGTFVKLGSVEELGASPICPSAEYMAFNQFAVQDGKDFLHCVERAEFSPPDLMRRRAVLAVPFEKSGLHEIKVGRIGEKIEGQVLGVIVGTYTPE